MDAGRLHFVLETIKRDYKQNEIAQKIASVASALTTSFNSTTEANAEAFRDGLSSLYAALDRSPINEAPPSQLEILNEINASGKVGVGLRTAIQNVLDANNVTPANALAEIAAISAEVDAFGKTIETIIDAFEALEIPYDALDPGESEIGLMVPWRVVDSTLEGVQKELHQFDKALRIFGELAGEKPESPGVRTISSSAVLRMKVNTSSDSVGGVAVGPLERDG